MLFCHIPLRWTTEKNVGEYYPDGRTKWHALLMKAGVQLVVSGHTHQPGWLPPGPTAATFVRGHATADGLTVTQHKLTGEVQYTAKVG